MADILVTENIVGAAMDQLRSDFDVAFEPTAWQDSQKLLSLVGKIRGIIVRNQTQVTAPLIAAAPNLEIIGRAGAGLDNIDTTEATGAGVVVTYTPRENSLSVAELTIGLMISLARKIPAAVADTRQGGWNRAAFTGSELSGKTLGIVGIGRIGTLVAERARAFGMTILAHDDYVDPTAAHLQALDVQLAALETVLAQADFVVCHVPLSDETRDLFNQQRFEQMKPGALFVNTSRGEVVDEAALVQALQQQRLAGAALDVRGDEPPTAGLLEQMDNVILTPHIAAFTDQAQERVVAAVCQDVSAVLQGQEAVNAFNFPRPGQQG
ncbi:MAG: hydroxyacid dehydrogenase [Pirellulaceae bacterium]|nr:hydroxyacid dehydrogenase [Pirellulaceae bacterium]